LLNENDLTHSYFCLDKDDPTRGFDFDASTVSGPTYPPELSRAKLTAKHERLILGSHLARHLRHELESQNGYTATVGIANNKILSKMGGNLNKPRNQTTIIPICGATSSDEGSIIDFMDSHDIGKVPGIGFKLARKIRARVLGKIPNFDEVFTYGGATECVSVRDVRLFPGMGPEMLEDILSGPGSQKGIGGKIWALIHGVDDSEVARAKRVPSQISQEDSYVKYLRTFEEVKKQLNILTKRLIERMHIDITEDDDSVDEEASSRRWLAHPRTLRLSTRPRPPMNSNGTRTRTFPRVSRSGPIPNFAFNLTENIESIASRLVEETLIPMFRKLHPEKSGWNLSLINVAVMNMAETGAESKESEGRDIGRMFKQQDETLKGFRVIEEDGMVEDAASAGEIPPEHGVPTSELKTDGHSLAAPSRNNDDGDIDETHTCSVCQAVMPSFAASAHERYHIMRD
jgi:DNA polymerase iota